MDSTTRRNAFLEMLVRFPASRGSGREDVSGPSQMRTRMIQGTQTPGQGEIGLRGLKLGPSPHGVADALARWSTTTRTTNFCVGTQECILPPGTTCLQFMVLTLMAIGVLLALALAPRLLGDAIAYIVYFTWKLICLLFGLIWSTLTRRQLLLIIT
jgi:hypothetical protein